jgi:hypothetical protein
MVQRKFEPSYSTSAFNALLYGGCYRVGGSIGMWISFSQRGQQSPTFNPFELMWGTRSASQLKQGKLI